MGKGRGRQIHFVVFYARPCQLSCGVDGGASWGTPYDKPGSIDGQSPSRQSHPRVLRGRAGSFWLAQPLLTIIVRVFFKERSTFSLPVCRAAGR